MSSFATYNRGAAPAAIMLAVAAAGPRITQQLGAPHNIHSGMCLPSTLHDYSGYFGIICCTQAPKMAAILLMILSTKIFDVESWVVRLAS